MKMNTKICPFCGHEMNENDNLCIKCGNQVSDQTFFNDYSEPQPPMEPIQNQQLPIDQVMQNQNYQDVPPLQSVPPMMSPVPQQQFFSQQPKVKKKLNLTYEQKQKILKYCGIGIAIIAFILLIVLIFNIVMSKDTKKVEKTGDDIKLTEDDAAKEEREFLENSYEYNYGDFIYNIPDEYTANTLQNGSIDLNNTTNEKEILISITKADFKTVNNDQEAVKKNYENKGLTINKIANQLLNNQDYIVLEAKNRDMQMLIALTSKEDGYIHVITVYNKSNQYDYDLLYEAANIIKYTKFKEKTA